jgi:RNA polymerase sigma-70 factor (ECF subfamily)
MNPKEILIHAYDSYADAIYRHCFFRTFTKSRAEELVQDVFMKTWEYLNEGKTVENMRAFLYRVANNLIVDDVRKRKESSLDALVESGHMNEAVGADARDVENRALVREIVKQFSKLEPDDRTVLVMRYVDDLDPKDIASALGMSANLVSVRLNRALKKVKRELAL